MQVRASTSFSSEQTPQTSAVVDLTTSGGAETRLGAFVKFDVVSSLLYAVDEDVEVSIWSSATGRGESFFCGRGILECTDPGLDSFEADEILFSEDDFRLSNSEVRELVLEVSASSSSLAVDISSSSSGGDKLGVSEVRDLSRAAMRS